MEASEIHYLEEIKWDVLGKITPSHLSRNHCPSLSVVLSIFFMSQMLSLILSKGLSWEMLQVRKIF